MQDNQKVTDCLGLPKDIELSSFNCLGFATGIFTWIPKGNLAPESDDCQIQHLIQEINSFSPRRVRLIQNEEDLIGKEYLCVVFLESKKNFLHAVRKNGRRWIEKNGHEEIIYLPPGLNPIEDTNCSWSILHQKCERPSKYLLAVNPEAPVIEYEYISIASTYCCLRVNLRCESFEIYDLPYGIVFYDEEVTASSCFIGEGRYLWKICLQNIDKSIAYDETKREGNLFNHEKYMLEILNVQQQGEDTYLVNAKPVLIQDVVQRHAVAISLTDELEGYLPRDEALIKAFI